MERVALTELEAILAVARRASFRAAALDLHMSTTALSHAVAKIEASLGARLFNRTTRSVSLTDAGRAFVEQLGPALDDIQVAMTNVRSQQTTPSGTLRINTFATAGRELLSPLVLEYLRRYPQVHVDLVTEGRMVDIVAEGFDLGVRMPELVPSDMIAIPFGKPQQYAIVASRAYVRKHGVPHVPADLLGHACVRVRLPNGALYRWELKKGGKTKHIDVKGPITLDEASLARTAVLEGIGLGFFMEPDVRADLKAGHLIRVLEDWTPTRAALCLYYPSRRNPSAALKAFIALARELPTP